MKQTSIYGIVCISLMSCALNARELRTPNPLLRYVLHAEVLNPYFETAQWNVWSGFYQRKANSARCKNTTGTSTCPLSSLLFNTTTFPVNDIFATTSSSPINILFSTLLAPNIQYTDRGLVSAFMYSYAPCDTIVVGSRVTIPFRSFGIHVKSGITATNTLDPELLANTVRQQEELINGVTLTTFAYRLDFLSQLPDDWQTPQLLYPLVNYANTAFNGNPITINNIDVTDNPQLDNAFRNPVTVVKRENTSAPNPPYALPLADAQALNSLPGNGLNVTTDERRKFGIIENYAPLGNNVPLQRTYWVEPSINEAGSCLTRSALRIQQKVDQLINNPQATLESIFNELGINFNSQRRGGLGDIDAQFFSQYWWNCQSFIEGNIAIRLPTAGTQVTPGLLFLQSLGNNGHPEIMFGSRLFWHEHDWLLLQANALYSCVLKRTENVAAPLAGALIKNIGIGVPARIRWGYFLCQFEASIFKDISNADYVIARFGYEGYFKGKDSVTFNQLTIVTPYGTKSLNAPLLEARTHIHAHSLYGEVSLRHDFNCCTLGIFGGAAGIVGGFNCSQETNWDIGLEIII